MFIVMKGIRYTDSRWPWFVSKSKKAAVAKLREFGFKKDFDGCYVHERFYAGIEPVFDVSQVGGEE